MDNAPNYAQDKESPTLQAERAYYAYTAFNVHGVGLYANETDTQPEYFGMTLDIDERIFSRAFDFVRNASKVCKECHHKSESACSQCLCEGAVLLLKDMEKAASNEVEEVKTKLNKGERILLRYIRARELAGQSMCYCINRINIKGILSWEKGRALKRLVAIGWVRVIEDNASGKLHKFAITVEDMRQQVDAEIK